MWRERIIVFLINHFCQPSDAVQIKRKHVILISALVTLLVCNLLGFLTSYLFGSFRSNYTLGIMCACLTICLVHCKWTRTMRSAPLGFAAGLAHMFYVEASQGAFSQRAHFPMYGLLIPILALFIYDSVWQARGWLLIFVGGNAVIHFLFVAGKLPDPAPRDPIVAEYGNLVHVVYQVLTYYVLFWFVVRVYSTELEARQTVQKDLQLFMRLSHEIRGALILAVVCGYTTTIQKSWKSTVNSPNSWLEFLATA